MQGNAHRINGLGIPADRWEALIDPLANLAEGVPVGGGSVVSALSQVGPDAAIGSHCFMRSAAIVSHDAVISDFVYLGQCSIVCGYSKIDIGAHIAPGAIIRDNVSVGQFALVGMGAIVIKDVAPFTVMGGNPARVIGDVRDKALAANA
jgi:acetyltransferase EpsM